MTTKGVSLSHQPHDILKSHIHLSNLISWIKYWTVVGTTLFMVFSAKYAICKRPKLDALRSQSVTSMYCQK